MANYDPQKNRRRPATVADPADGAPIEAILRSTSEVEAVAVDPSTIPSDDWDLEPLPGQPEAVQAPEPEMPTDAPDRAGAPVSVSVSATSSGPSPAVVGLAALGAVAAVGAVWWLRSRRR